MLSFKKKSKEIVSYSIKVTMLLDLHKPSLSGKLEFKLSLSGDFGKTICPIIEYYTLWISTC